MWALVRLGLPLCELVTVGGPRGDLGSLLSGRSSKPRLALNKADRCLQLDFAFLLFCFVLFCLRLVAPPSCGAGQSGAEQGGPNGTLAPVVAPDAATDAAGASGGDGGSMLAMFTSGQAGIESKRSENVFHELRERDLTEAEQAIIAQRCALQRRMLEEYEKRELRRKVVELTELCPEVDEGAAKAALEACGGDENDAAQRLLHDRAFLRDARRKGGSPACGSGGTAAGRSNAASAAPAVATAASARPARAHDPYAIPGRGRSLPAVSNSGVFVGSFKNRHFHRTASATTAAAAQQQQRTVPAATEAASPSVARAGTRGRAKGKAAAGAPTAAAPTAAAPASPAPAPTSTRSTPSRAAKRVAEAAAPASPTPVTTSARLTPSRAAKRAAAVAATTSPAPVSTSTRSTPSRAAKRAAAVAATTSPARVPTSTRSTPSRAAKRPKAQVQPQAAPGNASAAHGQQPPAPSPPPRGESAAVPLQVITDNGNGAVRTKVAKPSLGRVRGKAAKACELLVLGALKRGKAWHNKGYIFADAFQTKTVFRSSVELGQLCHHTCIISSQGKYSQDGGPTFTIVAADRPEEPVTGKSCTMCWTKILKRINAAIEDRRAAGENLPKPPKTAIAGPEYFGLCSADIIAQLEALDPEHDICPAYWAGKSHRLDYLAAAPQERGPTAQPRRIPAPRAPRAPRAAALGGGRRKRRRGEDEEFGEEDFTSDEYSSKWSGVSRAERYRARSGGAVVGADGEEEVPVLPGFLDPITLEQVEDPCISAYGHVMGRATWTAVLGEQGKCPFTKQSLNKGQLTLLTHSNLERFRDKIVSAA